jgi:hypothetical protein
MGDLEAFLKYLHHIKFKRTDEMWKKHVVKAWILVTFQNTGPRAQLNCTIPFMKYINFEKKKNPEVWRISKITWFIEKEGSSFTVVAVVTFYLRLFGAHTLCLMRCKQ